MANEVGDLPVAYPTLEQGLHSATHVARAVLGSEPMGRSLTIAHAWVGAGAGLASIFPLDGPMGADSLASLEAIATPEQKQSLEQLTSMKAGPADVSKIDWKNLLQTLLPLILKLLV